MFWNLFEYIVIKRKYSCFPISLPRHIIILQGDNLPSQQITQTLWTTLTRRKTRKKYWLPPPYPAPRHKWCQTFHRGNQVSSLNLALITARKVLMFCRKIMIILKVIKSTRFFTHLSDDCNTSSCIFYIFIVFTLTWQSFACFCILLPIMLY